MKSSQDASITIRIVKGSVQFRLDEQEWPIKTEEGNEQYCQQRKIVLQSRSTLEFGGLLLLVHIKLSAFFDLFMYPIIYALRLSTNTKFLTSFNL